MRFGVCVLVLVTALASGCSHETKDKLPPPAPTSTPVPSPYTDPYTREDPTFEPILGAHADYGELNGGVYKLEVPVDWNGDLVIYFAGSHRFSFALFAEAPLMRRFLIAHGYAWASTSYNTNSSISGDEAEQNAVLWDYFARQYGRPDRTYAVGDSAGGDGAQLAIEHYADRFSGSLVTCGVAGVLPSYDIAADVVVAAAFAAGVTQSEFDTTDTHDLVYERIVPALKEDAAKWNTFLRVWINMTGGLRPFAKEGIESSPDPFALGETELTLHLSDNANREYEIYDVPGVSQDEFNQDAIRFHRSYERIADTDDPTGDIQRPIVFLQTTGDPLVPLRHLQISLTRIREHRHAELSRVRLIERAGHCKFSETEYTGAFQALVDWVREEDAPSGVFVDGASLIE